MTTTITHLEARQLYNLERATDPSLPVWDAAPYLTRARWLWAVVLVQKEAAA